MSYRQIKETYGGLDCGGHTIGYVNAWGNFHCILKRRRTGCTVPHKGGCCDPATETYWSISTHLDASPDLLVLDDSGA